MRVIIISLRIEAEESACKINGHKPYTKGEVLRRSCKSLRLAGNHESHHERNIKSSIQ